MIELLHYPFIVMSAAYAVLPTSLFSISVGIAVDRGTADRYGLLAQLGAHNTGSVGGVSSLEPMTLVTHPY